MRTMRLALPLALLLPALGAPAAGAAEWSVVADNTFTFTPRERQVAVGDAVVWRFDDSGHTSTSRRGQPDSWNSAPGTTNAAGTTYRKQFNVPGRYQYVCVPHRTFMTGVIQVGTDAVADTIDDFAWRRRGNRVRISFELNEPAVVTYRLRGPSRRTVRRGRLLAGDRAFTVRRLRRGTYRGALTVSDDFDNRTTRRNTFVIR